MTDVMASPAGLRKAKQTDVLSGERKSRVAIPSLEVKKNRAVDSAARRSTHWVQSSTVPTGCLADRLESIPLFPTLQGGGPIIPLSPLHGRVPVQVGNKRHTRSLWRTSLSLVPVPEVIVA